MQRRSAARVALLTLASIASTAFAQTTAPATRPAPASPADCARALRDAQPGDRVLTAFDKLDPKILPPLALSITPSADAARLVFSDRPEYFRAGDGVACREEVPAGRVRVYTYHVPVPTDGKPRRVITRVENLSDQEATLRFAVHSEPAAGGDYTAIAKEAMAALLSREGDGDVLRLPPRGFQLSRRSVDVIDQRDLLAHGLFEFTTDRPLRITVAQVTASDDFDADLAKLDALPVLPMLPYGAAKDKAGRGSFATADFDVALRDVYDTKNGPAQVIVADGKTDPWLAGTDGPSGDTTINKGNYGVVYHLKLKWRSTDGRGVAVMMTTARFDAQWCGAVCAAVKVNDGRHPAGVIGLPRDAVRFNGVPQACVMQTYDASPTGTEGTIEVDYTPPGSCCLPTPILLVPIDK